MACASELLRSAMFFNSVGIVNAATTPITPRVINTSAKVKANFLFEVIPLKTSLQAGFKLPPPETRSMTAFWHVYTSFLLLYLTHICISIIYDFLKLCNIYFIFQY